MNLIQIQLDALLRDQEFRTKRPIWSKRRRRTSTLNPFDFYERPDREDDRERERDYPNPYERPERPDLGPPPEYPFQDFNYGDVYG